MIRIVAIEVADLFGLFHHKIVLKGPITIIHGPNGHGKTVMLNMVHGFVSGDMTPFRVPFATFELTFSDGTSLQIRQRPLPQTPSQLSFDDDDIPYTITRSFESSEQRLIFSIRESEDAPWREVTPQDMTAATPRQLSALRELDRSVPGPYSLEGQEWTDPSGQTYSIREILTIFPELRKIPAAQRALDLFEPPQVARLREELRTSLVQTQRLDKEGEPKLHGRAYGEDRPQRKLSVEKYSAELVEVIQLALADYGKHSQQLDRSFPVRLVESLRKQSSTPPAIPRIVRELNTLEEQRNNLMRIGLLDPEDSLGELSSEDVQKAFPALAIYVEDVRKKLDVFAVIARRVTLFMDIINRRLAYKRLDLDRKVGFKIRPLGPDKSLREPVIALRDLSSGEQHELVVLFELLFKVKVGSLILIDEPEISLHAAWQTEFVDDLSAILEVNSATALVATHSPTIIGHRWDLVQALKGPALQ
jgi:hypothetical protein